MFLDHNSSLKILHRSLSRNEHENTLTVRLKVSR
jgi:hypothetical protein